MGWLWGIYLQPEPNIHRLGGAVRNGQRVDYGDVRGRTEQDEELFVFRSLSGEYPDADRAAANKHANRCTNCHKHSGGHASEVIRKELGPEILCRVSQGGSQSVSF